MSPAESKHLSDLHSASSITNSSAYPVLCTLHNSGFDLSACLSEDPDKLLSVLGIF